MTKRRRGSRSARPAGRPGRFELLVERALDGIPSPFAEVLDEVAIVIADCLNPSQREENELGPDDELYGLYEGVPRTEYQAEYLQVPNRITLFRRALEADFPDPLDLMDEVRVTVIHELAHHMGIDDDRLEELGFD